METSRLSLQVVQELHSSPWIYKLIMFLYLIIFYLIYLLISILSFFLLLFFYTNNKIFLLILVRVGVNSLFIIFKYDLGKPTVNKGNKKKKLC